MDREVQDAGCGRMVLVGLVFGMGMSAAGGISRHDVPLSYHAELAMESRFQAAGSVNFGGSAFGSGTLIAPGWVLTAAHGTEITTGDQVQFTIGGRTYQGAESSEHPLWMGTSRITEGYDLALVRLEEMVEGVEPAEIYRGGSVVGRQAILVGAGLTGNGFGGQVPGTLGTLHAGLNTIDTTADQLSSFLPGFELSSNGLVIDFDGPTTPGLNRIGSAAPLAQEFFPGQGDSGGAYWVEDTDGVWRLASVQSWGTTNGFGTNFGMYGNMAISAKLYEDVVLDWVGATVPAPGVIGVFAVCGLVAARRRRSE
jgi:Trypsin